MRCYTLNSDGSLSEGLDVSGFPHRSGLKGLCFDLSFSLCRGADWLPLNGEQPKTYAELTCGVTELTEPRQETQLTTGCALLALDQTKFTRLPALMDGSLLVTFSADGLSVLMCPPGKTCIRLDDRIVLVNLDGVLILRKLPKSYQQRKDPLAFEFCEEDSVLEF